MSGEDGVSEDGVSAGTGRGREAGAPVRVVLSPSALQAIRAALTASAGEVARARHDYPPVHDFEAALRELPGES